MLVDAGPLFLAVLVGAEAVPGGGLDVLAAVLLPVDVGLGTQDARVLLAHVGHAHERADVEAHAVVEVRLPADGLLFQWLPANEDVVGGFAFEDQLQLFLEGLGGGQLGFRVRQGRRAILARVFKAAGSRFYFAAADPVAQVGVDQGLQQLGVELVIVDKGGETVAQAIPDVPDERAVCLDASA